MWNYLERCSVQHIRYGKSSNFNFQKKKKEKRKRKRKKKKNHKSTKDKRTHFNMSTAEKYRRDKNK